MQAPARRWWEFRASNQVIIMFATFLTLLCLRVWNGELGVPLGHPVDFLVVSEDGVHVPALLGNIILVLGTNTPFLSSVNLQPP